VRVTDFFFFEESRGAIVHLNSIFINFHTTSLFTGVPEGQKREEEITKGQKNPTDHSFFLQGEGGWREAKT
jgi:hypothetical protein